MSKISYEEALDEVKKYEEKKKKKEEKWYRYKKAGCRRCNWNGYTRSSLDFGFTNKHRCDCSRVPTDRYKKILDNKDITVGEREKKLKKFFDNNRECDSLIHDTDRSW